MLYLSFRVIIFFTSVMGLINMIASDEYTYVFFPVVMMFWSLYTFFDEEDSEYRRRNGDYYEIGSSYGNNRDRGWLGGFDDFDYEPTVYTRYDNPYYNRGRRSSVTTPYKNPEYKKIVKRCKRGPKITIAKNENENGTDKD